MVTTKKKEELENQRTTTEQNSTTQSYGRGYVSKVQPQIDTMMNQYLNRDDFRYDINADALYNQLRDQYALMGQQAMIDTMGQAQAMTGGYGNSYAQSVGQQAYQGYMQQLNDKIPDLYQLALNQYLNEGDQLLDNISLMMQQDSVDYGRYRDYIADQDDAYNRLYALMTGYGYKPSDEEMEAAGMSSDQRDAILRIGAYTPYVEEEEDIGGGRSSAYIDPNAQPQDGGGGGETWITYENLQSEVDQLKSAGASRQDINNHIKNTVNRSDYKPNVSAEQDTKDLKTVKKK